MVANAGYTLRNCHTGQVAATAEGTLADTGYARFHYDSSHLLPVSTPRCRCTEVFSVLVFSGVILHLPAAGNGQRTVSRKYPSQVFTAPAGSNHVPVIREQGNVLHGFLGGFLSFLCGLRGRRGFLSRRGRFLRGHGRFFRRRFGGGLRLHDGLGGGGGLLRPFGVRENRRHQLERHGDRHQQSQQFLHDATFFLYFRPVQLPPKQAAVLSPTMLLSAYH